MHAKKILVPIDFSEPSESALAYAVALAKDHPGAGSQLIVMHTVEAVLPHYDESLGVLEPEALRAKLHSLAVSREHQIPIETLIAYGDPREEIVNMAREQQVDIIVMGTRGRGGIANALLGSTAEAVLRNAHCPVLTVRDTAEVTAEPS